MYQSVNVLLASQQMNDGWTDLALTDLYTARIMFTGDFYDTCLTMLWLSAFDISGHLVNYSANFCDMCWKNKA